MRNLSKMLLAAILSLVVFVCASSALADGATELVKLPDIKAYSNGVGSIQKTGQESGDGFELVRYECDADQVELVVQEYIRGLRSHGIYICQSEKQVLDGATHYGVALRDMNRRRVRFIAEDSAHGWSFKSVSVYISFSTGGNSGTENIAISFAKDGYQLARTRERMRKDRRFNPADYYFYRDQLKTEEEKVAYDYILEKLEKMETPISFESLPKHMDYDTFFLVWYSVAIDNPQLFMIESDGNFGLKEYFDDGTIRSIDVYYDFDKKILPTMQKNYEQTIDQALAGLDPYMTDYEKELALHDWLCNRITKDLDNGYGSHNSYNGIVRGVGVCEGYSESFTELLHRAGIEAATVYGFVKGSSGAYELPHAWNIVCIDGNWYYVDVTWDDTDTPKISYDYFNLTTQQMAEGRQNGIGQFPLCNSRDASYKK